MGLVREAIGTSQGFLSPISAGAGRRSPVGHDTGRVCRAKSAVYLSDAGFAKFRKRSAYEHPRTGSRQLAVAIYPGAPGSALERERGVPAASRQTLRTLRRLRQRSRRGTDLPQRRRGHESGTEEICVSAVNLLGDLRASRFLPVPPTIRSTLPSVSPGKVPAARRLWAKPQRQPLHGPVRTQRSKRDLRDAKVTAGRFDPEEGLLPPSRCVQPAYLPDDAGAHPNPPRSAPKRTRYRENATAKRAALTRP